MFKHWPIVALIGALTLSLVSIVAAQDSTANVEVRVWQSTQDAERVYISARPEGGSWGETMRLAMSGLNSRETFRYEDITVAVPLPAPVALVEMATIDDSDGCAAIEAATLRSDAVSIVSCAATLNIEGMVVAVWDLEGYVYSHADGERMAFTSSYVDGYLERDGLHFGWSSWGGYPCDRMATVLDVNVPGAYIGDCRSSGVFSTLPDAEFKYAVRGFASFPNEYYQYFFRATLSEELGVDEARWFALVQTE